MEPLEIEAPTHGVRPDLDPEKVGADSLPAAENIIYRDGDFKVRPGFTALVNDVNQRPMGYVQYKHADGNPRAVMGTNLGWWKLNSTWVNITGTPLTGTADNPVIFRTFSKNATTFLLGTNGKDTFKKWDGVASTYSSVGGTPPIAKAMMVIFDRIVLGNLRSGDTISPLAFDVSANKDFDTGWATDLVALLADTEGEIVAMQEMGTHNGAVLKSDAIVMLIAQGDTTPFRAEWVKTGISGPASPRLTEKLTDGTIVMAGLDGLVSVFDGSNIKELPYAIQKQIVKTANLEKFSRGWMVYDSDRRELWIVYPLIGSDDPNGGMILNMRTYDVYPIRFPNNSMSAAGKIATTSGLTIGQLITAIGGLNNTLGSLATTTILRRLVFGDIGGQTYEDVGSKDGSTPIPFYWDTPVTGKAGKFTRMGRIRHRFKPTAMSQPVSVKVGKRNEGGPITYGTAHTINLNSARRKITGHRKTAEYFSLRFEGSATQEVVYQGSFIEGVATGGKR